MVKKGVALFSLFCLFAMQIEGMVPRIRAEVETKGKVEGRIYVYHSPRVLVDERSFVMEKKPLAVEHLVDYPLSLEERQQYSDATTEDRVSIYRFALPGQSKGIYLLPAIYAKVEGTAIASIPVSYRIESGQETPFLFLETVVLPGVVFYPGQRGEVIYRIRYNIPVELVVEQLPLLKMPGFVTIGDEQAQEETWPDLSIQTIHQAFRAEKPGVYTFGRSYLQGKGFYEDPKGLRKYLPNFLEASTGAMNVEVKDFPKEGKPPAFSGILGPLRVSAQLERPEVAHVGDQISLEVRMTTTGEVDTIYPPDLANSPGFAGFFAVDPLPPLESEKGEHSRSFRYLLRPLSFHTKEIPEIAVPYFDPLHERYGIARTMPLAIDLVDVGLPTAPSLKEEEVWKKEAQEDLTRPFTPPFVYEKRQERSFLPWSFSLFSCLLLLTAVLTAMMVWGYRYLFRKPKIEERLGLFVRQLSRGEEGAAMRVEESFLAYLHEKKCIDPALHDLYSLPKTGVAGEVRDTLCGLQKMRFARLGVTLEEKAALIDHVQQLYKELQEVK